MLKERISIPQMVLYGVLALLIFVLQTSVFGTAALLGYHVDLLPAVVAAAALLSGPVPGAIVGVVVGVLCDIGFIGVDGLYPLFFMATGCAMGVIGRLALRRTYVSMLILTAGESLILGLLRYLFTLMPVHAAFLPALRQLICGVLLTCTFCFIVYLPMRRISRKFDPR